MSFLQKAVVKFQCLVSTNSRLTLFPSSSLSTSGSTSLYPDSNDQGEDDDSFDSEDDDSHQLTSLDTGTCPLAVVMVIRSFCFISSL